MSPNLPIIYLSPFLSVFVLLPFLVLPVFNLPFLPTPHLSSYFSEFFIIFPCPSFFFIAALLFCVYFIVFFIFPSIFVSLVLSFSSFISSHSYFLRPSASLLCFCCNSTPRPSFPLPALSALLSPFSTSTSFTLLYLYFLLCRCFTVHPFSPPSLSKFTLLFSFVFLASRCPWFPSVFRQFDILPIPVFVSISFHCFHHSFLIISFFIYLSLPYTFYRLFALT